MGARSPPRRGCAGVPFRVARPRGQRRRPTTARAASASKLAGSAARARALGSILVSVSAAAAAAPAGCLDSCTAWVGSRMRRTGRLSGRAAGTCTRRPRGAHATGLRGGSWLPAAASPSSASSRCAVRLGSAAGAAAAAQGSGPTLGAGALGGAVAARGLQGGLNARIFSEVASAGIRSLLHHHDVGLHDVGRGHTVQGSRKRALCWCHNPAPHIQEGGARREAARGLPATRGDQRAGPTKRPSRGRVGRTVGTLRASEAFKFKHKLLREVVSSRRQVTRVASSGFSPSCTQPCRYCLALAMRTSAAGC
eukprot:scaffold1659_cov371-Prasinococcus_capsulatus_cf.AAC.4